MKTRQFLIMTYRCAMAAVALSMLGLAAGCAWLLMPISAARAAEGDAVAAGRFETSYLESRLLLAEGRYDQAVAKLEHARKLPGCPPAVYRSLAEAHLRRREAKQALEVLEDGIKRFPEDVSLLLLAAKVENATGRVDQALEILDKAIKAAPGRQSILELMSEVRLQKVREVKSKEDLDAQVAELIKIYEQMLPGRQGLERIPPLLILSSLYTRINKAERAVELAREAIQLQPREIRAYLTLGQAQEALKQPQEALKTYREVMLLDSTNEDARERIDKLLAAGNKPDARRDFYGSLARDYPEDRQLQILYARALVADKRWKEAEPLLKRIVERWPEEAPSRLELARVWVRLGRAEEAVKAATQISAKDDELAELASLSIAQALLDEGDRVRAVKVLDAFRKTEAGKGEQATIRAGTLLLEAREDDQVIEMLVPYAKSNQDKVAPRLLLMQAYVNKKQFTEAQALLTGMPDAFKKSREKDYLALQSDLYRRQKAWDKALVTLNRLLEVDGRNAQVYMEIGTVYQELGRNSEAEAQFRKAIELAPQDAETYNTLGYFYAETNQKLEAAQELIDKALQMKPDAGNIMDSLGWVYYRKGDFKAAVEKLKRAVEMLDKTPDPLVYEHLGDAYEKLGKINEAREAWRKALTLDADTKTVKEKLARHKE